MSEQEYTVNTISCQQFHKLITNYLDFIHQNTPFQEIKSFEAHYNDCEDCIKNLQLIASIIHNADKAGVKKGNFTK